MPGISGIIEKRHREENAHELRTMVKCMMHEKFYTSGTYVNDGMGLHLGWVCMKDSFSDCLPIWNETKDICIIFSGEDFTDTTDIDQLRAHGHQFEKETASYIVHLYEEIGISFLAKLNGWFSGVLVDLREGRAIIFNDRYGLGRIYYHDNKDAFYFSTEAKSLLSVLPELRQLDSVSFGELFSCGCTLENRTLFAGISLIPGGAMWTFSPHKPAKKEFYFNKEIWESQPQLSVTEYYEKLKETFARILPKYFRGRERVAVSLTGGIDTRMIMAWASCPPYKVPCYTFGGMYRDCADVKIARQVARVCQQRHDTITVNRKFFIEFPALAKRAVYYTDGATDVSGSVELYVNKMAREIAPVRLNGNYGDQVLRNVIGFKPNSLNEGLFDPEFARLVSAGRITYDKFSQERGLSFLAFKQLPWHSNSHFALERIQLTQRTPYLDNDLVALVYQAPPSLGTSIELSLRLIAEGDSALSRIPTDRGMRYRSVPMVTELKRVYQWFTFKAEYAFDYGMPQWLAGLGHRFPSMHPERIFLGRHKFCHFRVWYREELSKYVKDVLLDPRTLKRPYLDGRHLEEIVNSHITGNRNYTEEIHRVLTSELIQRHLIEQK
jgi:asparagine synthase (glutamine-hydrolysing)